jgi:KTSC domain
MIHTPVNSSNIASLAHCPDTQTLQVKFKDRKDKSGKVTPGALWEYVGVPAWVYTALKNGSVGEYFARHIRGIYSGAKVELPVEPTAKVELS